MIHVYPVNDRREHVTEGTGCWCEPVIQWDLPETLVIHNSLDGREALEQDFKGESEDGQVAFEKKIIGSREEDDSE